MQILTNYEYNFSKLVQDLVVDIIPTYSEHLVNEDKDFIDTEHLARFEYVVSVLCMQLGYAVPYGRITSPDIVLIGIRLDGLLTHCKTPQEKLEFLNRTDIAYALYQYFGELEEYIVEGDNSEQIEFEQFKVKAKENFLKEKDEKVEYIESFKKILNMLNVLL